MSVGMKAMWLAGALLAGLYSQYCVNYGPCGAATIVARESATIVVNRG